MVKSQIRHFISVYGRACWTLFDIGVRNTYVVPAVAELLITSKPARPIRTALGGEVKQADMTASCRPRSKGTRFRRTRS